jgi:signal transduction histidine kinase
VVRGRLVDAAVAVAVAVACVAAAAEGAPPAWWPWVLVTAVAGPVAVRRYRPSAAALTVQVAATVLLVTGAIAPYAAPGLFAAVALTQYTVGTRAARPVLALVAGAAVAAIPAVRIPAVAVVAIAWLAGAFVRHRRQVAGERTARAVTEERLRIAREVHDTVAHSLTVIAMKASVARHVAAVRPEESAAALEVIETTGREALAEMRRAVGLLRNGPESDFRALAGPAADAGVDVTMTLDGVEALPGGVRRDTYRIVQEALTNMARHARATTGTVRVAAVAGQVTVEVADDGRGGAAGPDGHGLRGMRERAAVRGGSVTAGPRPGGGFTVTAVLPYGPR